MNDHDRLIQRVIDALLGVDPDKAARARKALADYTPGDGTGALILMFQLEQAVGEKAAHAALDLKPPRPGLVYCCPSMGWVTPHERGAHIRDDDYGDPADYGAPTAREVRYTVPMDVVDDGHDATPLDRDGTRTLFSEFAREDREAAQRAGEPYLNDWAIEDPF